MYRCAFWARRHFFLFRPRVFSRALGSVASREPAKTPRASLRPRRRPWHVLWGFKVASPVGEGFRPRRVIQAHANLPTLYLWYGLTCVKYVRRLIRYLRSSWMSSMSPDITWWLEGISQIPKLARYATTFSTITYNLHGLGRIASSHARSCVE